MKPWFTAREGAQLASWQPHGILEGIIEVHPEHEPIMHWIDGHDEELKCDQNGCPIVVTIDPFVTCEITVGVAEDEHEERVK